MADLKTEFELKNPPLDGISSVHFSPASSDLLLVSSWDNTLRLYDLASNSVKSSFQHRAAVLSGTFDSQGQNVYSGGLDSWIRKFDVETEKMVVLGAHDETISSVVYSSELNSVLTGSWDKTVKLWDPRKGHPESLVSSHQQPERVYAMDLVQNMLVVATAGRRLNIWDTRNMAQPLQERASSLKYGTSALACMSDGKGYATASVEGRISVEYFDPSQEEQARKYAFKCHRQTIEGGDLVWPVNALAFNSKYNTFASGGSDGTVSLWDHTAKKRLRQYPKYQTSITSIAFSADGTRMAVGGSYAWDVREEKRSEYSHLGDTVSVHIREVGDEAKPKIKA